MDTVLEFLIAFGYLAADKATDTAAVADAVAKAQEAYGLPVTGDMDSMTERVIARTPRCGVSDAEGLADGQAFWGLDTIAWFVESFPPGIGLTRSSFEGAVDKSFGNWAEHIPRDFKKAARVQDANVIFRTGRGPRANFDGIGGTLAWMEVCSRPNYRGVLNGAMDGDEPFVVTGHGIHVILVENVLTHEIGHALGFMHDTQGGQLMSPTYHPDIRTLQARDKARAQRVYGVREPTPTPTPTPPTAGAPSKVQVLMGDNSVYQFENPVKIR